MSDTPFEIWMNEIRTILSERFQWTELEIFNFVGDPETWRDAYFKEGFTPEDALSDYVSYALD